MMPLTMAQDTGVLFEAAQPERAPRAESLRPGLALAVLAALVVAVPLMSVLVTAAAALGILD